MVSHRVFDSVQRHQYRSDRAAQGRVRGNNDDLDVVVLTADGVQQLQAIFVGQVQVEQNHVDVVARQYVDGTPAVVRAQNPVVL